MSRVIPVCFFTCEAATEQWVRTQSSGQRAIFYSFEKSKVDNVRRKESRATLSLGWSHLRRMEQSFGGGGGGGGDLCRSTLMARNQHAAARLIRLCTYAVAALKHPLWMREPYTVRLGMLGFSWPLTALDVTLVVSLKVCCKYQRRNAFKTYLS